MRRDVLVNKEWLKKLASDVEAEYGTEARDNVFGDLDRVGEDSESIKGWFRNFIKTIDELVCVKQKWAKETAREKSGEWIKEREFIGGCPPPTPPVSARALNPGGLLS